MKLSLRDVAKTYGDFHALHPTSLQVREGEFVTILGPSGSGKTTMLQIIAGITTPTSGEIWISGSLCNDIPPEKRDIGVVFQNYALFPHMTVRQNISYPLEMRRVPRKARERKIADILRTVALTDYADRLPKELSGGQQQRVALARCAVYEPPIILMDEPLGALDRKLRDQMQLEIKRLHRELKATLVYVTHDQDEAMAMSDRICLMREGRIEQIGTPDELYANPRSEFVATFLGYSNIVSAQAAKVEAAEVEAVAGVAKLRARLLNASVAPGDSIRVMVRPERTSISAAAAQAATENRIAGTVQEVVPTGPVVRYYVATDQHGVLMSLQVADGSVQTHKVGDKVTLGWDMAATKIFTEGRS